MGLFDRLKNVFSGGERDSGLYFYVKLDRGGEIVQLRLEPQFELVPDYEQGGYFSHKTVVGPRTYRRAEATFRFDANRQLSGHDISGGELVSREEWQAQSQREDADSHQAGE